MDSTTGTAATWTPMLLQGVEQAMRFLLNQQNRDPYTPTYGCFDRRYWAWKLVDYAEATFQRYVYALAWWWQRHRAMPEIAQVLSGSVWAGLEYAAHIQHQDGSFDQAFPHEHSFGATAFLLHPLLTAYRLVQEGSTAVGQGRIEQCLQRSAEFLCRQDETHGHIANHLAGGVLSLLVCADFFQEARYERRADELLARILTNQSAEGWFLEYAGADPGYQTLCLYYLAQVYRLRPHPNLHRALERAVEFLAWFVHPDGSFGGEYGSRRTAIYYPGGLALLGREFPLAWRMTEAMLTSILARRTMTPLDMDMGNLAPLLANHLLLLEVLEGEQPAAGTVTLPWERINAQADFRQAGLYVRSTAQHYTIVGVSNGGVVKLFERSQRRLIYNDGGYVGQTVGGELVTTQMTELANASEASADRIQLTSHFYQMAHAAPTPWQFVVLRLLNLTLMRNLRLGNWVKSLLVRLLISGKQAAPLQLTRAITWQDEQVQVRDVITRTGEIKLAWLRCGRPFVAIHMASAGYFEQWPTAASGVDRAVEVAILQNKRVVEQTILSTDLHPRMPG
jgi:hypothetical protein